MARKNPLKFHHTQVLSGQPAFKPLPPARNFFLFGISLLIAIFIASAIFYINTHVKVYDYGYQINQAIQRKRALIEENKRLRLEIAQLKTPGRIEKEVHESLSVPQASQIVYLQDLKQSQFYHLASMQSKSEPAVKSIAKPEQVVKKNKVNPSKAQAVTNKKKVAKTNKQKKTTDKKTHKKKTTLAKSSLQSKAKKKSLAKKKNNQKKKSAMPLVKGSSKKILAKIPQKKKPSLDPLP
ncbi:MAG: cell division protein FtsL [Deltaproteobacteria bacterium]|nr:cell division protein FtsL [Deltaproteobacteria bacterium]